jgi:hypothetical protein
MFSILMFVFCIIIIIYLNSMKQVYLLFACALFIVSCKSTPDAATTDGSTLVIPKDTVTLSKTDSVQTLDLKLSCGCGFQLAVTSLTGDTNVIKYSPVGAQLDTVLSTHTLQFSYSPSKITSATAPLTLNFMAKKHTYFYTNKVSVKIGN